MKKNVVIFGTGYTAEIVYDYLSNESDFKVVAFTADDKFIKGYDFLGLPLVPFSVIDKKFSPNDYSMFVALGYKNLNTLRYKKYLEAKCIGYNLISFISPYSYIGRNVKIGDNCFIMEKNNIQYGCSIHNNVLMWASNHIGHGSIIESNVYISSNVTVSGYCVIGKFSFLGVNSTIADKVKINDYNLIGANTFISFDTEKRKVYAAKPEVGARYFKSLSVENFDMFNPGDDFYEME